MISRRAFLQLSFSGLTSLALWNCGPRKDSRQIKLSSRETFSSRGHELWKNKVSFSETKKIEKNICIAGGGVSGLSAAYHLNKNNSKDILLLELGDKVGGNSASGKNEFSRYPYGAHYLTLPNPENVPLISFLNDKGIIQGFDNNGKAIYNEADMCYDPEERLFLRGGFQEGLVPNYGLDENEKKEIALFFKLMDEFRAMKGSDGNYFFNIPVSFASQDITLNYLDKVTFEEFLKQKNFQNKYLLWYLNYCCRDDFGGGINKISAWAGINYFAAHRAQPSNTDPSRVLTWPEGNDRLVKFLSEECENFIQTGCLVKNIKLENNKVYIEALDFKNKINLEIACNTCIIATPPFVTAKILDKALGYPVDEVRQIKHSPWLVAAVTLTSVPQSRGVGLCWDNVAYGSKSLGYIYNQHQFLNSNITKQVISVYMPLDDLDDKTSRKTIENRTMEEWRTIVINELEIMHPGINTQVEEIEVCVWGHGMILPSKGLAKGGLLKKLSQPINNKLFFAHTDLAGYSTFEEGFDLGYKAAMEIIKQNV